MSLNRPADHDKYTIRVACPCCGEDTWAKPWDFSDTAVQVAPCRFRNEYGSFSHREMRAADKADVVEGVIAPGGLVMMTGSW